MALLLITPVALKPCSPSTSSSSSSRLTSAITWNNFSRVHRRSILLQTVGLNGLGPFWLKKGGVNILKASSDDVDGVEPESPSPPSEAEAEIVSVEDLPLESKLQQRLEQKMKMKLAKKIRLRRKRLVRKRHLRKKGRWPPSKMKKNKNV